MGTRRRQGRATPGTAGAARPAPGSTSPGRSAGWAVLAAAVGLAGCGTEARDPEAPDLPQLTATRSTTFGDDAGPGALTSVFQVAVAPDGTVYASEPTVPRVVAFRPDGTFDRVVAEAGSGPGDVRIPGGLGWRGDTLTVTDFGRGLKRFGPDGLWVDPISFQLPVPEATRFAAAPMALLDDGSVVAFSPAVASGLPPGGTVPEVWYRASRDGDLLDTLYVRPVREEAWQLDVGGRRPPRGRHPFPAGHLVAPAPDGSSVVEVDRTAADPGTEPSPADGGTAAPDARDAPDGAPDGRPSYRVVRIGASGDTVAATAIAYDPVPVGPERRDAIVDSMATRQAERAGMTPGRLAAGLRDVLHWPDHVPAVDAVLAGSDGTVWLRSATERDADSVRWEVLGEGLQRTAAVWLPAGLDVKVVSAESVYGVETDSLDVPTIVRYAVGR